MIKDVDGFMTTEEAAECLKLTKRYVAQLCRDGGLPNACRIGKRVWLIPKQSVRNYVPGLRGFAAVNAKIRKQKKEEFVECYKTVMDVMGLPVDGAVATEDNGSSGTGAVYLTVEEAAKIMEQSCRAVRHYCGNGRLAGAKKVELFRKGNLDWLIPYASVEALLEQFDRPSKLKKAVPEV